MTLLPAQIIAWEDFREAHPEGLVLSRDTGFNRSYGQNPYVGYDTVDQPPFLFDQTVREIDGRLLPKERVSAFVINGEAAAYPFFILEKEFVVSDTVGGTDVVIFFKPGARSALGGRNIAEAEQIGASGVFETTVDGQKLTFRSDDGRFVDNETDSVWNILGEAVEGPLAGERLQAVVHGDHFWFAWGAFEPDTKIYAGADAG